MKILCLKDNNFLYVYKVENTNEIKLLNELKNTYGIVKKDIVNCTYQGGTPIRYGIYSKHTDDYEIISSKLLKMEPDKKIPGELIYGRENWMMMSREEQDMRTSYVGGTQKGKSEITLRYFPEIYKIYKNLMGYNSKIDLINFTDLIKYYNQMNNITNNFNYDSTLYNEENSKYKRVYNSQEEYDQSLIEAKKRINEPFTLNEKEKTITNISTIFDKYVSQLDVECLGTIDLGEINSYDIEILNRFATANDIFNIPMFDSLLKKINSVYGYDVDTLKELLIDLPMHYDLDGMRKRIEIKKHVKQLKENEDIRKFLRSVRSM